MNEFLKIHSLILIPIIIMLFLIAFLCRQKKTSKKFLLIVSVNMLCIFSFFFMSFFLAGTDSPDLINIFFPIYYVKWQSVHKMILLFWLILSTGYFIDNNDLSVIKKYSEMTKIVLFLLVLFIFRQSMVLNYIPNLKETQMIFRENRTIVYMTEKLSLKNKEDNFIIVPEKYKEKFNGIICLEKAWFIEDFNDRYKTNKTDIKYIDIVDSDAFFTKNELENLKFKTLIEKND